MTTPFCTGTGKVMMPGFQDAFSSGPCVLFLFTGWVLDSPTKYTLAVLGTFAMGFCNELLSFLRRLLAQRLKSMPKHWQLLLALVYGVHMVLAYWMMLLVMTYEYVLFTALILGLVAGFTTFTVYLSDRVFGDTSCANNNNKADLEAFDKGTHLGSTPCCGGASAVRH